MKLFLIETIKDAGELALDYFQRREAIQLNTKATLKDIVTEADVAVEQLIKERVNTHLPDFGFLGEESGIQTGSRGRWIVDPIDGTLSFSRGTDYWSISIAVEIDGVLNLSAVYAPAKDQLYVAEKGHGATCNGQPIRVSSTNQLHQALVATGFACLRDNLKDNNLPRYNRIAAEVAGTRIRGSAALDLCKNADGQLDAFWEQTLNIYDVAAGALILTEAGGTLTDFSGNPGLDPTQIFTSNGHLHEALLELM